MPVLDYKRPLSVIIISSAKFFNIKILCIFAIRPQAAYAADEYLLRQCRAACGELINCSPLIAIILWAEIQSMTIGAGVSIILLWANLPGALISHGLPVLQISPSSIDRQSAR